MGGKSQQDHDPEFEVQMHQQLGTAEKNILGRDSPICHRYRDYLEMTPGRPEHTKLKGPEDLKCKLISHLGLPEPVGYYVSSEDVGLHNKEDWCKKNDHNGAPRTRANAGSGLKVVGNMQRRVESQENGRKGLDVVNVER